MKKITIDLDDETYENLCKIYEKTIKSELDMPKISIEEFIANALKASFSWTNADKANATNHLIDSLKTALKNFDPSKLDDFLSNFSAFNDLFTDTKDLKKEDKSEEGIKKSDIDWQEAMKKKS